MRQIVIYSTYCNPQTFTNTKPGKPGLELPLDRHPLNLRVMKVYLYQVCKYKQIFCFNNPIKILSKIFSSRAVFLLTLGGDDHQCAGLLLGLPLVVMAVADSGALRRADTGLLNLLDCF